MRLLVIGASGLTGQKIARLARGRFETAGTYNMRRISIPGCKTHRLDVTDPDAVEGLIGRTRPDRVINTSALHDVDYCEADPARAFGVNRDAVGILRDSCDRHGCRLVHLSTDYVFDGALRRPYSESDKPCPLGAYGRSKLDGERIIRGTDHCVIRPSVVYGWAPSELSGAASSSGKSTNFAVWLLQRLSRGETARIVTDQFSSPTLADSLADAAVRIAAAGRSGLYHISGLDCQSRYDFATRLAEVFGYDAGLVRPTDSSRLGQKARRPAYSCLDCAKAVSDLDPELYHTDDALRIMKSQVERDAPHLVR